MAKYKLVIFDVNIVLITTHSIIDLAEYVGMREEVNRYITGHTSGMISMSQALANACKQLKGLRRSQVVEHAEKMEIMNGAQEMVNALRKEGIVMGLITTGFKTTMDMLNKRLGNPFKYIVCNELVFKDGVATGEVEFSVMENDAKAEILHQLAEKEGLGMNQTVAVGDSMGDQNMLDAAGLGIAFNPNKALIEYAAKHDLVVVKEKDLRKIVPYILR
jgi:phosphoserine phosphatase